MSRYPDFHTTAGIGRRLAEGRGTGHGSNYKPYFTRFDVRSRGARRETYCAKSNRSVHLLRHLEFQLFILAHADPEVIDIREQFPLPIHETRRIAAELGILHPQSWRSGVNITMTTDLVLTKRSSDGIDRIEGWSGEYAKALQSRKTVERKLIEAEWYRRKGYKWRLMTELDVPPTYVANLAWLHPLQRPDAMLGYPPDLPQRVDEIMRRLMQHSKDTIARLARESDLVLSFSQPVSLYVCRYLLAMGLWQTDLRSWQRERHPLVLQ